MGKLIFLAIFGIFEALAYTLQSDYPFRSNLITSKEIFPDLNKDIFIYKAQSETDKIFINSRDLIATFDKYGVFIEDGGNRRVRFVRVPENLDIERLVDFVYGEFSETYPSMEIEDISVTPKYTIETMPEEFSIIFSQRDLKHAQGYFYVETNSRDRIYFKYSVNAYLEVFKSSERVRKGQILDNYNTYPTKIRFKRFRSEYVTEEQLGSIQAKSYIPKDRDLTMRIVEKMVVVKRGAILKGFVEDGSIYIEIEVTALQDGGIGDEIQIKTYDGTILKGVIMNSKYVKVL
jgi:flagella basal body P-ring formation protein FlgA